MKHFYDGIFTDFANITFCMSIKNVSRELNNSLEKGQFKISAKEWPNQIWCPVRKKQVVKYLVCSGRRGNSCVDENE